jgi:cupin-like protein
MPPIIDTIDSGWTKVWGAHTVKLRHSLACSDLFSDDSLAKLIEIIDAKHIDISTMGDDVSTWAHCDHSGIAGSTVLEAVRRGRLWINMMAVEEVDPNFRVLLDEIYGELESAVPYFSTFKRKIGLLISSPDAQVFYHFDVPGQSLWQLRGRKKIWIYPPTEPFLRPVNVESVIRSLDKEDIPYEPWFDDYAHMYTLEPGDMLHWPLNGPHRVSNLHALNVSLTTEHWTSHIRRSYAMNYGNGVLRRDLRSSPRSRSLDGPAFWAKAALTTAWRTSGLHAKRSYQRILTHRVDPDAPLGRRALAERDHIVVTI